jgi:hypothetical protein
MGPVFNFSYRKVDALRFVRIGRFGFSFWLSRASAECEVVYYRPRKYRGGRTTVVDHDT